jgi:hypothetical protein
MNKKIIILILAVLIIITSIFLIFPKIQESNIRTSIEKANYCEIDSDCIDAGGKCPFGCFVYVNKNEVEKISNLIQSYDSKCIYGCVLESNVKCENNKCIEIFE